MSIRSSHNTRPEFSVLLLRACAKKATFQVDFKLIVGDDSGGRVLGVRDRRITKSRRMSGRAPFTKEPMDYFLFCIHDLISQFMLRSFWDLFAVGVSEIYRKSHGNLDSRVGKRCFTWIRVSMGSSRLSSRLQIFPRESWDFIWCTGVVKPNGTSCRYFCGFSITRSCLGSWDSVTGDSFTQAGLKISQNIRDARRVQRWEGVPNLGILWEQGVRYSVGNG